MQNKYNGLQVFLYIVIKLIDKSLNIKVFIEYFEGIRNLGHNEVSIDRNGVKLTNLLNNEQVADKKQYNVDKKFVHMVVRQKNRETNVFILQRTTK